MSQNTLADSSLRRASHTQLMSGLYAAGTWSQKDSSHISRKMLARPGRVGWVVVVVVVVVVMCVCVGGIWVCVWGVVGGGG